MLLSIVTILYITSPEVPFDQLHSFPLFFPHPSKHQSILLPNFFFYQYIEVVSQSICLILSDIFHWVQCPQASSIFSQIEESPSILFLKKYSLVYISHIFFIHSCINSHLSYLYHLAISKNAAMNKEIQIYL